MIERIGLHIPIIMLVSDYLQEPQMKSRKSAAQRKSEILSALLDLADRIGPDRLTTNDVASAVGVTQAAIFRHFPTKADLWAAAGETISSRMRGAWDEALSANATPDARLRALVAAQFSQIAACPALPMILHSRELNVENPALRKTVQSLLMQFQEHLTGSLRAMEDGATLDPRLNVEDAAIFLTSLIQGLAIRWGLGARNFDLKAEGLRLFDVQLALFASEGGGWRV